MADLDKLLQEILQHPDIERLAERGNEAKAWCPFHNDRSGKNPSMDVHVKKKTFICHSCDQKGGIIKLAKEWDIPIPQDDQPGIQQRGLTVAEYAEGKKIPVDELVALGIQDGRFRGTPAVEIPYLLADGELFRMRYRLSLTGASTRFRWGSGSGLLPYGLTMLNRARTAGRIFIVEGETDTQTLWHRGRPALGIPGANVWKDAWARYLDGIPEILLIVEPDVGGDSFESHFGRSRLRSRIRVVRLEGVKDPSELHLMYPDEFDERLDLAVAAAVPLLVSGLPLSVPYEARKNAMIWLRPLKDGGEVDTHLTNFHAQITRSVFEDDGSGELNQLFEIKARLNGKEQTFTVPASKFAGMDWAIENMGPKAIVFAGQGIKDHTRVAIQATSADIDVITVFSHTGWTKMPGSGEWIYLHGGGAIGETGEVQGVHVQLHGSLQRFILPEPLDGDDLAHAIRQSLLVTGLVRETTAVPAWLEIWRAPLGPVDHTHWLYGASGGGKTAFAALLQQHHGQAMTADNMPGNWNSTANALEAICFLAKDVLLVIDDFVPEGSRVDVHRMTRDAHRILRAQANKSGRMRMTADIGIRPERHPRGMILVTGEDIPPGFSVLARTLVNPFPAREDESSMNWEMLTALQRDARQGLFAGIMAAYVKSLAPRMGEITEQLPDLQAGIRDNFARNTVHQRTPGIIADLLLGGQYFLEFAVEAGAMTTEEAIKLEQGWWELMEAVSDIQASFQVSADPVERFRRLITAALSSGQAHLVSQDGGRPVNAPHWGWRVRCNMSGFDEFEPKGRTLGWVDDTGDSVFLMTDVAIVEARRVASGLGIEFTHSESALGRLLKSKAMLRSTLTSDHTKQRRSLNGQTQWCWHLDTGQFFSFHPADSGQQVLPVTYP